MAIDNKDKKILNVPHLRFPEFSGEWEMVSLQDIATINPKSDPLQNTFIYIDLEAVEKGELRKIQEIMREEAPSRAQRVIDNNDILFQCVRPYQKNNYIHRILNTSNQQWVASTGYAQIRTTELPNYIYHLLNTDEFNRKVMVRCTGSSYPAINSEDLATIHLYYTPDKKEQLKISRLLDLLDKRIATQNKIIEDLKKLKSAISERLFKSVKGFTVLLSDLCDIVKGKQINGENLSDSGNYYVMNGGTEPSGYYDNYNVEASTISISEGGNSCGYVLFIPQKDYHAWIRFVSCWNKKNNCLILSCGRSSVYRKWGKSLTVKYPLLSLMCKRRQNLSLSPPQRIRYGKVPGLRVSGPDC